MAAGSRGCGMLAADAVWSGRRGPSVVRSVRLTTGAHVVLFFSNVSKTGSTWKLKKEGLTLLQKFPNFACG
jgi:hypothetical protein